MPHTIKTILDKFEEDYSSFKLCNQVSKPELDKLKQFIQSSLTSLLDSLVEEIREQDCYTQTTLSSGKKVNLIYKEELINIINSHK